jgi:hypothetical protein
MKNPDRKTVSRLEALPNIGKATADDLRLIGVDHPKKLIGKDPFKLYEALCKASGTRQDPCVLDGVYGGSTFHGRRRTASLVVVY